jgi:magnesium transporter
MSKAYFYHFSPATKMERLADIDQVSAALKQDGFIWLDYYQPTAEDLHGLKKMLGLHPLAVEDCMDDNQIPKVEDYPQHTFLLFNAFHYADKTVLVDEVDMFIGQKFLVTASGKNSGKLHLFKSAERLIEREIENAVLGPAFLAHILLDHIVDQKFIAIEALEDNLNAAEDGLMDDLAAFKPAVLMHLRRELLTLRKSLFHEREILIKITRKDCNFVPEAAVLFYRDIYDHLAKFFELTESYRDVVTSLMEMYLSMLNNRMAKSANDTNATVRRLTLITTIFMPLTLLAGVGGMSEWSMMTGSENWRVAYPLFLLAMAVIGALNYVLLKWLDRRRNKEE